MTKPSAIDGKVDSDHKKAECNLNWVIEATGIDYRNEIMLNESAAVSCLAYEMSKLLFQGR